MMTLRFSQLSHLWGADEAQIMLQLLDELRDALWESYGEEIAQRRRAQQRQRQHAFNHSQLDLWDDNNPTD